MIKIQTPSETTVLTLPVNPTTEFSDVLFLKSILYNKEYPLTCSLLNHYSNFIKIVVDTTELKSGEYKYVYSDTTGIIVIGEYYKSAEHAVSTADIIEVEKTEKKTFKRK